MANMNSKIIKVVFVIVAYLIAFFLGYLIAGHFYLNLTQGCTFGRDFMDFGCGLDMFFISILGGIFGVVLLLIVRIIKHNLKRN